MGRDREVRGREERDNNRGEMRTEDVRGENKRRMQKMKRRRGNGGVKDNKTSRTVETESNSESGEGQEGEAKGERKSWVSELIYKKNKNQSSQDTINNESITKDGRYSIFNSTRSNPITLMAPSKLQILDFEA